jgi:phosphoserine phosphatase RsbU/P
VNDREADVSDDRTMTLERELAEERRAREALVQASIRLNSLLNLPELLQATMSTASDLLCAETSSLLLLNDEESELTFEVATGEPGEGVREMRIPANQGIAGWVVEHGEAVVVDDVASDSRFYSGVDQHSGFQTRSILAVPLSLRDRTIGVVEVCNKRYGARFTERDRELAYALAAQAAVAIENARLYKKLADAVVESRISYRL